MKKLTPEEILSNAAFKEVRPLRERAVIREKAARRVGLGPNLTFLFENRVTMAWQIQEMCRVEHITAPAAIQHELDTYNGLLPGRDELAATLLVEYEEPGERDRMLAALRGLHEHVRLEIEGEAPVAGVFDADQFNTQRISSVQFVRFPLSPAQVDALCDLRRAAALVCDHAHYRAHAPLAGAVRGALVEDLLEGRRG